MVGIQKHSNYMMNHIKSYSYSYGTLCTDSNYLFGPEREEIQREREKGEEKGEKIFVFLSLPIWSRDVDVMFGKRKHFYLARHSHSHLHHTIHTPSPICRRP